MPASTKQSASGVTYAIGDVEFDNKGEKYLWLLVVNESLDDLIADRYRSHSSFPNTVHVVNMNRTKRLMVTHGMAGGRSFEMAKVTETLGCYFDLAKAAKAEGQASHVPT